MLVGRVSDLFPLYLVFPPLTGQVYPKETIDFMSRQETEHLLFILLGHFSGEVLQSVHDCSVYWAWSVHTTFDDLEVIGRVGRGVSEKKNVTFYW